jgi:diamine N-acetyltransferase
MPVTLRDITRHNWRECVNLTIRPDQQHFVETNAVSMAQARYEPEWIPLAVYDGAAMRELLARMRNDPACDEIFIDFAPDNAVAEALYLSLGFEKTGAIVKGEVVARLSVRQREPS